MIKLFVGGIPLTISEIELVKLFSKHGHVVTIQIIRDKKSGACKGYAFLEMKDQNSADKAVDALDQAWIEDRMLTVRIVEQKAAQPTGLELIDSPELSCRYIKVERPSETTKKKRPRREV